MRVLILADSNWRDSFGVAHLTNELYNRGVSTYFASFDICSQATEAVRPHAIILNHVLGARNKRLSDYVKRNGGVSIVLPTEGRPDSEKQKEAFVTGNDLPDYVDLFLSWSEQVVLPGVRTKAVGCPRFDIYQPPYDSLIQTKEHFCARYNLDPDRPIIALASSFPKAKFHYQAQHFNRSDSADLGHDRVFGDPDDHARREYEAWQEFMLWARIVNDEYGGYYNIIAKPHPMEDVTEWEKLCGETGITHIKGDYIFNVVNASDLLIARIGCLTHQDMWLVDKPTIHCDFGYRDINLTTEESLSCGWAVDHFSDLLDAVYDWKNGLPSGFSPKPFLEKWGFSVKNSGRRTARAIADFLQEKNPQVNHQPDIVEFNSILHEHDKKNAIPQMDNIGHFGKAITSSIIFDWQRRIRDVETNR